MSRHRRAFLCCAIATIGLASSAGCGGATQLLAEGTDAGDGSDISPGHDATTSVSGTVDGAPFLSSESAGQNSGPLPPGTYPWLEVSLLDRAGACDDALNHGVPVGTRVFRIYVFNERDQQGIGAGTYSSLQPDAGSAEHTVFAGFFWHDFRASCNGPTDRRVIYSGAGSVTFDEVSATRLTGSFDATLGFATADNHVSGTFSAPVCRPDDAGLTPGACE